MTEQSPVEIILSQRLKEMPFNNALQRVRVDLAGLPDLEVILTRLEVEREAQVYSRTKLTELGTARKRDLRELGWYQGLPRDEGVWGGLRTRMLAGGLADAVEQIHRSSEEIVASIAEPRVDDDRRLGLVIGNVQSGKTANYSAVIAKALDSGYRFVLVLSGIHNNLRKQTQQRLDRDLGVLDNAQHWYRLTDADGDFGDSHAGNASAIVAKHERVLAVVKKNSHRLTNLLAFLRSLDPHTKKATPFLIIDDESDQATPDSSAGLDDEPTAINRLMRELWAEVRNGTYVGYTATPFANVFMDPNSEATGANEELYPGDFIHVMPTPDNYFGAEKIFGLRLGADEDADSSVPDVIRMIPNEELLRVSPRGRDISSVQPALTNSLKEAMRWFIVASAVRRVRGQQREHSTMLLHTTHRVDPHFAMREAVEDYLEPLKRRARDGEVDSFRDIFHAEIDRAAELYTGFGDAPTWPRVSGEIPNVLRNLRVAVDNGKAGDDERLSYVGGPQTVIVIGGGTLSRGLTLEGLFVSFFTRTSNTYDTLLQMGRWFGYRPDYEDLQRIWLSPGLGEDYRFLATVEADLRRDIATMTASEQTPAEIGVRVRQHPGRLQITSPAKMKHVSRAEADFEGFRLQTTRFDVSSERLLTGNAQAAEELFVRIARYRAETSARLFEDVPVGELEGFFSAFKVHERFRETFDGAFTWSQEKLPDKLWNVVVQSGGRNEEIAGLAGFDGRTVRRAPILTGTEELRAKHEVNIRALMGGQDIIADLRLQGPLLADGREFESSRMANDDQYKWRRRQEGADGRGLLVLYPISRRSRSTGAERMPMDEALAMIDPALLEPGRPPIMGLALIAPYDTTRVLRSKGSYVSVKPVFGEAEEIEDVAVADSEGDYLGSGL